MSPSPPSVPVPVYVPSSHAEDAGTLLFRTLGHYRTAQAGIRTATRPRRLGRVLVSPAQEQAQATLVRMLSITEGFTGGTLLRHAEPLARVSRHAVAVAVYDDAAVAAVRDWQAMRAAYKRWLEVQWRAPDYDPVHTLAEARNAVVHGLGTLTRQQTRKDASGLRTRLTAAKATVCADDSLVLPEEFIVEAARRPGAATTREKALTAANEGRLRRSPHPEASAAATDEFLRCLQTSTASALRPQPPGWPNESAGAALRPAERPVLMRGPVSNARR